MATTVTTKCRRCNGTGIWAGRGECFGCNTAGVRTNTRYTAAEKAERARFQARFSAARETTKTYAATLDSDTQWNADYGFLHLRDDEPDRFAKLLDSVEAGRVADVVLALAEYERNRHDA